MRKIFIICLLFTLHCSLISAQVDSGIVPHPFIGVNGGVSIAPRTIFMSSSNTYWMDFVKPGFSINLHGGVPLLHKRRKALGVTGALGYYGNNFDINKFIKSVTPSNSSAAYTQAGYGYFSQYSFLAGAYATYTVGKTTLLLRALAGGEYLTLPNVAFNISYPPPVTNYSETITFIYSSAMAFAFGGGVQVGYAITKNLSLTYSSDVLASYASYNCIEYITRGSGSSPYPITGVAHVFMANAALGLCYNLGR